MVSLCPLKRNITQLNYSRGRTNGNIYTSLSLWQLMRKNSRETLEVQTSCECCPMMLVIQSKVSLRNVFCSPSVDRVNRQWIMKCSFLSSEFNWRQDFRDCASERWQLASSATTRPAIHSQLHKDALCLLHWRRCQMPPSPSTTCLETPKPNCTPAHLSAVCLQVQILSSEKTVTVL